MNVGDVVRLTEYGNKILSGEYTNRQYIPPIGSTAVVKAVSEVEFKNPAYFVEFFGWPGDEWEVYDGEIESVSR